MTSQATFYGVGVGTGDPELLTLKALRIIQKSPVVAYLVNDKDESQAKQIACLAFDSLDKQPKELPIYMPMLRDRRLANESYDQAAVAIQSYLDQGQDVAFLCEGDPLFFGSFAYLLERLQPNYQCQSIAGIASLQAASAALCQPLTRLQDSLAVMSGRHSDTEILQALQQHDSIFIMKVGQSRSRILGLIEESDRTQEARYLEYIGREQECIVRDVTDIKEGEGIYFSVIVVTRT